MRCLQGNWEYTATKYALRGFMRTVRRSSCEQGIRINYVAPCWIKSAIRSAEYEKHLMGLGVEFGESEDVANCMMRIACDRAINGKMLMSKRPANVGKNMGIELTASRPIIHDHAPIDSKGGFHRLGPRRLRPDWEGRVFGESASISTRRHRR